MKRNKWFYISITLTIILVVQMFLMYAVYNPKIEVNYISLKGYDDNLTNNMPKQGYIVDVKVAAEIGGELIDTMCKKSGKKIFFWETGSNGAWVDYDETLRLWRISKGYCFHDGAVVILDQDTGTVIDSYFQK